VYFSSSCAGKSAKRVLDQNPRPSIQKESIQEDGLPGQARQ
jgi:hypothetical protein